MSKLKAWLRSLLFETPPDVVRPPRTPEQEHAWKRERLRRAVAVGDVDEAKKLTRELAKS